MLDDVTSLRGRRADQRWNRTSVGDLLERLTWSRPDQEAIVGAPGASFDPAFARVTYREADAAATVAAITVERATAVWAGSPLLLRAIADAAEADPAADLTSLTVALFSRSTMHPELVARLNALWGPDLGLLEVFPARASRAR